jgi:hypothetical protein
VRAARTTLAVIVAGLIGLLALPDPRDREAPRSDAWTVRVTLLGFREAIAAYRADHGRNPGWEPCDPADGPGVDAAWLESQLCRPTNAVGEAGPGPLPDAEHPYGPYLQGGLPANPATGLTTVRILDPRAPLPAWTDGRDGWVYDPREGLLWLDLPGRLGAHDVGYFGL